MKTKILTVLGLVTALVLVLIAADLPISRFPNVSTPNDSDLFVLAQTVAPVTNKNIRYDQLRGSIRSGLATESYVNSVSNSIVTGSSDHLWTNNGTFLQPTTNGDTRLIGNLSLTSTGLLGGLAVTQDVRILGHNSTSNFVWTCTNSTTGEGEWRTAGGAGFAALEIQTNTVRLGLVTNLNWTYGMTGSISGSTAILGVDDSTANNTVSNGLITIINTLSNSVVSANVFTTNQWTTNIPSTPVNGRVWFQGFPGQVWLTNNARNRTWEWNPTNQAVRIGSVGDVGIDSHHYLATSNYWDFPNVGFLSWAYGTNNLVNASFSAVASGVKNLIYTNAPSSFIGGGTNNAIRTNSYASVIGGGFENYINTDCELSVISGGQQNDISGGSSGAVIAGGVGNTMRGGGHRYSVIGGGVNNILGKTGDASGATDRAVIGGGEQNTARGNYVSILGGHLNIMQGASDWSFIGGGQSNALGAAPSFGLNYGVICGGAQNQIANDSDYSLITGGRLNTISSSCSNGVIDGGAFNSIAFNKKFCSVFGGERNAVNANYGFSIGHSNTVSADYAGAIGTGLTVADSTMIKVQNLSSYALSYTIAGAGNGNTNYTLQAIYGKQNLGSSNVNIVAVMQTTPGQSQRWRVAITNDSPDTWGFSASSTTNRWFWQGTYGTNQPSVLTNNTRLVIDGESEGTNTWATYNYFAPAK